MASDDPAKMLHHLTHTTEHVVGQFGREVLREQPLASDRKLRLFGLNLYLAYLTLRGKEQWYGAQGDFDWIDTDQPPQEYGWNLRLLTPLGFVHQSIESYTLHHKDPKYEYVMLTTKAAAAILRDVVGNPFRPIAYPCCEAVRRVERVPGDATTLIGGECPMHGTTHHLSRYLTPTVTSLGSAAYSHRNPDDSLQTDRLLVLSDALEEADCTDANILGHLRSLWPHYRGCWALDLLVGKE